MAIVRTALAVAITALVFAIAPSLLRTQLPKVSNGYVAPGFEQVGEIFRHHVESGIELGGAFAAFHKGELVVEYWGGYADVEAQLPWDRRTLSYYASSTKGVSATLAAMLADRGQLDYDRRVASFWPEFAQNGKENITVRQILSHTAGLATIEEPFSALDIKYNPEKVANILARQKPTWEPGTDHGYHAWTIGLYVDQFIRRLDPKHRKISQFFKEEVAQPFDLDMYIGLPLEENYRCTRTYPVSLWSAVEEANWSFFTLMLQITFRPDSGTAKVMTNPSGVEGRDNQPEVRSIPSGSGSGFGTAAALAKFYSILAQGGTFGGKKLISRAAIEKMIVPQAHGPDRLFAVNMTIANGMNVIPSKLGSSMFGTPGWGGQMGFGDLDHQVSWAYITNHHRLVNIPTDRRVNPLVDAVYDAVKLRENTGRQ